MSRICPLEVDYSIRTRPQMNGREADRHFKVLLSPRSWGAVAGAELLLSFGPECPLLEMSDLKGGNLTSRDQGTATSLRSHRPAQ